MRLSLRRLLIATSVLSIGALLWPQGNGVNRIPDAAQAQIGSSTVPSNEATQALSGAGNLAGLLLPVPEKLAKPVLKSAGFDPFVGVVAPQREITPTPVVEVAPPPPPPVAPSVHYEYLGKMIDPSGKQWVYLSGGREDREISVAVGTQLSEGYVVNAIDGFGVHLFYPPLGVKALIPVPHRLEYQ